jgi:hypothetical protein
MAVKMKRTDILLLVFLVFSCVSKPDQNNDTVPAEMSKALNFSVTIHNNTLWDISIISENKDRMILKGKSENVTLSMQNGELSAPYDITCYVKLTNDVVKSIPLIRKIIKNDEKSIDIDQNIFECDESYFVITNTADSVIKVILPNSNTYRSGLGSDAKGYNSIFELRNGQSNVYKPENFSCSVENEKKALFPIPQKLKKGWIDSFTFDGSEVKLTDSRPLHRVGESAWVKTIPNFSSLMPLVMADGGIHLFASTDKSITRYVYDSAGNLKEQVKNGDNFKINTAIQAGDGFFIAGQTHSRGGVRKNQDGARNL